MLDQTMTAISTQSDNAVNERTMSADGAWVERGARAQIEVENPATGEIFGTIPGGAAHNPLDAVRRAKTGWGLSGLDSEDGKYGSTAICESRHAT